MQLQWWFYIATVGNKSKVVYLMDMANPHGLQYLSYKYWNKSMNKSFDVEVWEMKKIAH